MANKSALDLLPELINVLRKIPKDKRDKIVKSALALLETEEPELVQISPDDEDGGRIRYGIPM